MALEINRRLVCACVLVAVLLCALVLLPLPDMSPEAIRAAALTLFVVVFWAMESLPGHLTTLTFFILAVVSGVSPNVVFSGFQSGGFWLAFSGMVLGIAIRRTGLAARLAGAVVGVFGYSYHGLLCGLVLVGLVLMFLMASGVGRVLLLVPLAQALAERVGLPKGSPGANGFIMAASLGTLLPAASVLPANLPNVLLMGTAGTLYDVTIQYGNYLLFHLPITGLLKAVAIVVITLYVFPATTTGSSQVEETSPLTRQEAMLSVVLVMTLGLWLSDGWHGIAPAWIGLGAAVFCLLPPVGFVPEEAFGQIQFGSLIYMAGIIGLGSLVASSGLGDVLGDALLAGIALEPGHDAYNFAALVGVATTLGLFTTQPGVPAVLTPMAADLAHGVGWPIITVLMTQVIGYSNVILPYQAPALVLAMERSGVRLTAALRLLIVLAVLTLVVLAPLNYLWWRLLGYFYP